MSDFSVITSALVLFLFAATLGIGLAVHAYRRGRGSSLGYLHGAAGLAALAFLFARVFDGPRDLGLNSAAFLFSLAAVGGLLLLVFALRKEAPPLPFVVIHGAMAVVALLVFVLNYAGA